MYTGREYPSLYTAVFTVEGARMQLSRICKWSVMLLVICSIVGLLAGCGKKTMESTADSVVKASESAPPEEETEDLSKLSEINTDFGTLYIPQKYEQLLKTEVDNDTVILAALLMALTLVTKAIQHNPIGNDYLCFLIMLLLFPCVMRRCEGDVSFYRITIFFACGIITAALTAQQIATFPNISQFIKVDSYLTVTRLSGFYGDPNFYSAHIAACLAGTQLLLCHEKSRRRQIVLAILALVLLYCGLLSASKSFIIVTACLFLLWVPILLEKGTFSSHFRLFVGLLCAGIIIASSSAFRALLQIVDDRFAQASNLSELTTGRTDLWRNYIHEFLNNPITLLFGEGYTSINLNNKASHNTLIQVVYQFGLIGMPLLISWVVISLRNLFTQLNAGHVKWKHALLMCVGVALPWMGIDILQFDEFFLLPVYAVIGIAYSTRSTENKKLESSKGEI